MLRGRFVSGVVSMYIFGYIDLDTYIVIHRIHISYTYIVHIHNSHLTLHSFRTHTTYIRTHTHHIQHIPPTQFLDLPTHSGEEKALAAFREREESLVQQLTALRQEAEATAVTAQHREQELLGELQQLRQQVCGVWVCGVGGGVGYVGV